MTKKYKEDEEIEVRDDLPIDPNEITEEHAIQVNLFRSMQKYFFDFFNKKENQNLTIHEKEFFRYLRDLFIDYRLDPKMIGLIQYKFETHKINAKRFNFFKRQTVKIYLLDLDLYYPWGRELFTFKGDNIVKMGLYVFHWLETRYKKFNNYSNAGHITSS